MTMLIISGQANPKPWIQALHHLAPDLAIQIWPQVSQPETIKFALVWVYPYGELLKYPHLKCISSMGAGVDYIINDPQRPVSVPIVRIVDNYLMRDMTQYLVWAVLNQVRHIDSYQQAQARNLWTPHLLPQQPQIGIMGLGKLGKDVAIKLRDLGFAVASWSKSPKTLPGVTHFLGQEQLHDFLKNTDVLICLLPLTAETRGILNLALFNALRRGAYIINAARGGHLVEKDLLRALESDQLSGACLDVFQTEPLPVNHPFWKNPKIKITPHIASVSHPNSVAPQILDNYRLALADQPLLNQVNLKKGY